MQTRRELLEASIGAQFFPAQLSVDTDVLANAGVLGRLVVKKVQMIEADRVVVTFGLMKSLERDHTIFTIDVGPFNFEPSSHPPSATHAAAAIARMILTYIGGSQINWNA